MALAEMLRDGDRLAIGQARAVRASDDWQRLDPTERAVCAEWVRLGVQSAWKTVVFANLGHVDRAGRWHDADPPAAAPADLLPGAEWVKAHLRPPVEELVPEAPGLAYAGLLTVAHALRGTGKTVYAGWLVVSALRAGRSVLALVDDDTGTWAGQLHQYDAPLDKFRAVDMHSAAPAGALESLADRYQPDLVVIDSWRRWAQACGCRDANHESHAGPVADRTVDVASSGPAVLVLANQGKPGDGNPATMRGSLAVEDAATGAVRSIERDGDTTTIRTAGKVRTGVPAGPWSLALAADGFTPTDTPPTPTGGDDDGLPEVTTDDVQAVILNGEAVTRNAIAAAVFSVKKPGKKQTRAVQRAINLCVDTGQLEPTDVEIRNRKYVGYRRPAERPVTSGNRPVADAPGAGDERPPRASTPLGETLADAPAPADVPAERPVTSPADARLGPVNGVPSIMTGGSCEVLEVQSGAAAGPRARDLPLDPPRPSPAVPTVRADGGDPEAPIEPDREPAGVIDPAPDVAQCTTTTGGVRCGGHRLPGDILCAECRQDVRDLEASEPAVPVEPAPKSCDPAEWWAWVDRQSEPGGLRRRTPDERREDLDFARRGRLVTFPSGPQSAPAGRVGAA